MLTNDSEIFRSAFASSEDSGVGSVSAKSLCAIIGPIALMGKPKYSFKTLYKLATDGVASFSVAPLKIAQFMAFLLFLATMGILAWSLRRQSISQLDPIFALESC